ncbi:MAG TPA: HNH endonuclease signature motif containing protein, partial [Ilumatobacteraceae bacterium]|nr:HNH endonuclease signature motif containing protein [Ilumatobacteraceae bacterium]
HQLVDLAYGVCVTSASRDQLDDAVTAHGQLESMIAGRRLELARALAKHSPNPAADLAAHLRSGTRDAKRTVERMHLSDLVPQIGAALDDGAVSTAHLDRLQGSLGRLTAQQRTTLLADADDLAAVARRTTPEQFDQHLRNQERAITADDGMALVEAQRRAVRLHNWISDDGMHHFKLSADPLTGLKIFNKVRAITEAKFHGGNIPADAPDLPIERQAFLRAHALIDLLLGTKGVRLGQPEITVVVDTRVPAGAAPVIDWGLPIQLPVATLQELVGRARVNTVWMHGDDLVWAPGKLDLGATSRIAGPDQRRALRAMYATCAVPGCDAPFDGCDIHHVLFWEDAKRTDLAILAPICSGHHSRLHAERWQLNLDDHRRLTIRLPNGNVFVGTPNRIDQTRQRSGGSVQRSVAQPNAPP